MKVDFKGFISSPSHHDDIWDEKGKWEKRNWQGKQASKEEAALFLIHFTLPVNYYYYYCLCSHFWQFFFTWCDQFDCLLLSRIEEDKKKTSPIEKILVGSPWVNEWMNPPTHLTIFKSLILEKLKMFHHYHHQSIRSRMWRPKTITTLTLSIFPTH